MCYFITGTLPIGVNPAFVRRVYGPDGHKWQPLENDDVQRHLPSDVGYFLVTGRVCDCDSALARHVRARDPGTPRLPKAAPAWSDAKDHRWLEQRGHVEQGRGVAVPGDLAAWYEYLKQLRAVVHEGEIGLLIHAYRGNVATEGFAVALRRARLDAVSSAYLMGLEEDTLYLFE